MELTDQRLSHMQADTRSFLQLGPLVTHTTQLLFSIKSHKPRCCGLSRSHHESSSVAHSHLLISRPACYQQHLRFPALCPCSCSNQSRAIGRMGKKKSGSHGAGEKKQKQKQEEEEEKAACSRAFVLKVAMHCTCNGCTDKIRAAVKDITLVQGVEAWDQSALESKGELRLVGTADPEKLRQRLHKATRKNVDLVFPNNKQPKANSNSDNDNGKQDQAAAAAQALLLSSLQSQKYGGGQSASWANHPLLSLAGGGGGWNAQHQAGLGLGGGYGAAAAYPWAVQQQQPDPYAAYSGGAYPVAGAVGWGAYPHLQLQGQGHGYGGGAWHGGHGY